MSPLRRDLLSTTSFAPLSPNTQLTSRGFTRPTFTQIPPLGFTGFAAGGPTSPTFGGVGFTPVPGGGGEPPLGGVVPGILDTAIPGIGLTPQDLIDLYGAGSTLFGGDPSAGTGTPIVGTTVADPGPCPGLLSVRLPDGTCLNLEDLAPGGDPAVTGQVNGVGSSLQFGTPVNGRFGVGVIPRVEGRSVRRCPRGMALGLDGVCYDGLPRNSPRRAWPMGVKPLLTGGERNAIRIAGRAAGKLARSQKTLKKTARALAKVC